MQVFHTDGDPPRRGRIILAIIGWTQKSSEAETKSVRANRSGKAIPPLGRAGPTATEDVLDSEYVEMMAEGPIKYLALGERANRTRIAGAQTAILGVTCTHLQAPHSFRGGACPRLFEKNVHPNPATTKTDRFLGTPKCG